MRIGWLASVIGCFGAVREMVEMSNALVRLGHTVTIYSETGGPVTWLPCLTGYGTLSDAEQREEDVLILMCDWRRKWWTAFQRCTPRLRAVCVMGFDPSIELGEILRGETITVADDLTVLHDALATPGMLVLADSTWQCRWLEQELGIRPGPPIGGINPEQFRPVKTARRPGPPWRVIATGDPRERKGLPIVRKAADMLKAAGRDIAFETYWGRRLTQEQMVEFYAGGHVFIDAQRRAGWSNPVAEAMACGTAVVCCDIGGVRDFAEDNVTAVLVPVDDARAMADAAWSVLSDVKLRQRLINHAYERIQAFSYDRMAPPLVAALEERLR